MAMGRMYPVRRKQRVSRKTRAARMTRSIASPDKTYRFIRSTVNTVAIFDGAVADTFYANLPGANRDFELTYLPNSSEFTDLFDQYRIDSVKMTFAYSANSNNQAVGPNLFPYNVIPRIGLAKDPDDNTVWATVADGCECPDYNEHQLDKPFSITVKPKPAIQLFNGAFSGYGTMAGKQLWIDCASNVLPHYGLKWVFKQGSVQNTTYQLGILTILCKWKLSFKGVR